MKCRKKPVVVEAVQFTGMNFGEIEKFVGADAEFRDGQLIVATLEGPLRAAPMDLIIKGVEGELYPIKPDIFDKTYDWVTEKLSTESQSAELPSEDVSETLW